MGERLEGWAEWPRKRGIPSGQSPLPFGPVLLLGRRCRRRRRGTWQRIIAPPPSDTTFVSLGYAKVAILGVVQGVTELIPVSSSAHMRAIPALLGWPDPGAAFSAAMQLAALAAVVTYFWADIAGVARATARGLFTGNWSDREFRLGLYMIVRRRSLSVSRDWRCRTVLNACNSPLRTPLLVGGGLVHGGTHHGRGGTRRQSPAATRRV